LEWILADIPLKSDENFQVVIETVNGNAHIAIDDLSFTPSCKINAFDELPSYVFTTPKPDATCPSPNQIRCQTSNECIYIEDLCNFRYDCNDKSDEIFCPWACNFDANDNLCSWTNVPKDSDQLLTIKWDVGTSSQFKNTGPQFDHSTLSADGSFLYFDPIGELPGHKARLISPVYNQAGLLCSMEFWYQLSGDSTSILNVYIMSGLTETRIARLQSSKTLQWTEYKVNLPSCLQQFQVVLEGLRGSTNTSFIFVDDIRLNNCQYQRPTQPCTNEEFKCNSFHCVPRSGVCDLAADCCDKSDEQECSGYYRCNFEQDMCGFKASNLSSSHWVITRADSSNEPSAPFFDHTTQTSTGHYLAVSAPLVPRDADNAFVQIGVKKSQKGCKMRIWYLLDAGLLEVWWRKEVYGQLVSVFSTNQASSKWKRVDVDVPEMDEFELVIEGVKTRYGILAIDDVTFTKECEIDQDLVLPFGTLTTLTESD
ncbi:MAM and LDL-receptor class A domain-containing 1, partial [Brachionus plicatilis]